VGRIAALGVVLCLLVPGVARASSPGNGPALSVAIDPVHPQTVWATGLNGLHRSDDGGATFRHLAVPVVDGVAPIQVVTVAGGVFALPEFGPASWSGDGGRTWVPSPAAADGPIARSPVDPATVVAVRAANDFGDEADAARRKRARAARVRCLLGGRFFFIGGDATTLIVSDDGGRTWKDLPRPPAAGVVTSVVLAGGGLVATVDDFDLRGIKEHVLRTTDRGAHWTDITTAWQTVVSQVPDAVVPTRLWALKLGKAGLLGDDARVMRSDDLGSTWTAVGSATGIGLASTPGALVSLSAPDACRDFSPGSTVPAVVRSTDGGATFAPDVAGLEGIGLNAYEEEAGVEVVATPVGVFHRTGGGTWHAARTRIGPAVVRELVVDGGRMFAGTPDGLYVSRDHGRRWSPVAGVPAHADVQDLTAAHGRVAVAVADPAQPVYEGRAGHPLRRVRGVAGDDVTGLAYEPAGTLLVATGNRLLRLRGDRLARVHRFARFVAHIAVDGRGRILAAVALRSPALLVSDDGGRTFGGRPLPLELFVPRIYPTTHGYYLDADPQVGYSSDGRRLQVGGFSFAPIDSSHARIAPLATHGRVAWAADEDGVVRTHDGGGHWQPYVTGQLRGASAVAIDGRELVYATMDKGIRRRALVVGDLSRPRLHARYDRRRHEVRGVVRDGHLRDATVSLTLRCDNSRGDITFPVGSGGRVRIPVPVEAVRVCPNPHMAVTALDRAGNASATLRFTP
jgi:photosystem II stability/assembly factor-like uncharacterized protein